METPFVIWIEPSIHQIVLYLSSHPNPREPWTFVPFAISMIAACLLNM